MAEIPSKSDSETKIETTTIETKTDMLDLFAATVFSSHQLRLLFGK